MKAIPRKITLSLSALGTVSGCYAAEQPNVIFILADDLGYGDLGCYGQQIIQTPHLNQMASEGIRLTDFYAGSSLSAPSRCALMTGKHTGHCTIRMNVSGEDGDLGVSDYTLPMFFKANGYVTAMFGKWGLGMEDTDGAPEAKGFDEFTGYTSQGKAHNYFPGRLVKIVDGKSREISIPANRYSHDLFVEEAKNFIERNKDKPFFLYLPFTIPHAGLEIPEDDMQYTDKDGVSIFPETTFPGKASYKPQPYPKATYASMISKMDSNIGSILALLQTLLIDERTLVIFTSDNGPHSEGGYQYTDFNSSGDLKGHKRSFNEGGIREPFIARWPGKIQPAVSSAIFALWDIFPTCYEMLGKTPSGDMDGISMYQTLTTGVEPAADRYMYWEISQNANSFVQAVRYGKWKLIRTFKACELPSIRLFDLSTDPGENNNVAKRHPEIVSRIETVMDASSEPTDRKSFRTLTDFKKN